MKFCGKCRTALGPSCPNCSFENPRESISVANAPRGFTATPELPRAKQPRRRRWRPCASFRKTPRGLFLMYLFRAEHTTALEAAEQLRRLGEKANDSRILLWGHYALGSSSCWLGELRSTLHHLRQSLAQYDSANRRS